MAHHRWKLRRFFFFAFHKRVFNTFHIEGLTQKTLALSSIQALTAYSGHQPDWSGVKHRQHPGLLLTPSLHLEGLAALASAPQLLCILQNPAQSYSHHTLSLWITLRPPTPVASHTTMRFTLLILYFHCRGTHCRWCGRPLVTDAQQTFICQLMEFFRRLGSGWGRAITERWFLIAFSSLELEAKLASHGGEKLVLSGRLLHLHCGSRVLPGGAEAGWKGGRQLVCLLPWGALCFSDCRAWGLWSDVWEPSTTSFKLLQTQGEWASLFYIPSPRTRNDQWEWVKNLIIWCFVKKCGFAPFKCNQ